MGHPVPVSLRLKLISWVALATSLVAFGLLAVVLVVVEHGGDAQYVEAVRVHVLTEQMLQPALVVGGMALLAIVALITWLVTLHLSFRLAGPLYRFRRNFEAAQQGQPAMAIRQRDCLQETSRQMQESIGRLHQHYQHLEQLTDQAQTLLANGTDEAALAQVLTQLRDEARRVRLD